MISYLNERIYLYCFDIQTYSNHELVASNVHNVHIHVYVLCPDVREKNCNVIDCILVDSNFKM